MTADVWTEVVELLLRDDDIVQAVARLADAQEAYRIAVRTLTADLRAAEAVGDAPRCGALEYALARFTVTDDTDLH